jgi:hypothetical protein
VRDYSICAEKLVRYVVVYSPVVFYPFGRICDFEFFSHVFQSTNQPHLTTVLSRRFYVIAHTPENCRLEYGVCCAFLAADRDTLADPYRHGCDNGLERECASEWALTISTDFIGRVVTRRRSRLLLCTETTCRDPATLTMFLLWVSFAEPPLPRRDPATLEGVGLDARNAAR